VSVRFTLQTEPEAQSHEFARSDAETLTQREGKGPGHDPENEAHSALGGGSLGFRDLLKFEERLLEIFSEIADHSLPTPCPKDYARQPRNMSTRKTVATSCPSLSVT